MIMGGALVVAIVVALFVQSKLAPKSSAEVSDKNQVLVATKKLMTGETLKQEDVRWQPWPDTAMFKGVIRKSDEPDTAKLDVYDAPLRRNIESGEPVTKQALIPDVKGGNNFLAASIGPGMRALAISVKANTTAGGFVAPGDHVDVILSYSTQISGDDKTYAENFANRYASQTILSNVRVLAVDQSAKDEDREAKVSKTVTLEVSEKQAEVLSLADRMGQITLALRRIGDNSVSVVKTPVTTDATTSNVLRRLREMKQKADSGYVRLYSGTTVQNVPVRPDAAN